MSASEILAEHTYFFFLRGVRLLRFPTAPSVILLCFIRSDVTSYLLSIYVCAFQNNNTIQRFTGGRKCRITLKTKPKKYTLARHFVNLQILINWCLLIFVKRYNLGSSVARPQTIFEFERFDRSLLCAPTPESEKKCVRQISMRLLWFDLSFSIPTTNKKKRKEKFILPVFI